MTYLEILKQLDLIEQELASRGLSGANGRLGHYRRAITKLTDPQFVQSLPGALGAAEIRQLFYTLSEASELCVIFQTLGFRFQTALWGRLRDVLDGPASAREEAAHNASNRPRNLQFELYLMAHLLKAGFPLADESLTDVKTFFRNREILIECKRPQRSSGIRPAIRDAVRQLTEQKRNDRPNALKVVAISLGKVLTEGDLLLHAPNETIAKRSINEAVQAEIDPNIPYFHQQAKNKVIGILAVASLSMVHLNSVSPATVAMQVFFANPQLPKADLDETEEWFREYEKIST